MERYLVLKGEGYEIYIYIEQDEDILFVNKDELNKCLRFLSVIHDWISGGFRIEEAKEHWPYESYIKTNNAGLARIAKQIGLLVNPIKGCISNGDCDSCNLLYGDCPARNRIDK